MNAAIKLGLNATWHELGSHSLAAGGLQSKETRKVFSTAVPKLMDRATVKSCLLPPPVASARKAAQTSPGPWTKEPPQCGNWVPVGPQCGCWFWGSLQLITNRACRLRLQRDAAVGGQISERPGQSNTDQLSESPLHFGVNILIHTMTFKYNALQKAQSKMPTGTINLSIWVMQAQCFASPSASSSWTAEKGDRSPGNSPVSICTFPSRSLRSCLQQQIPSHCYLPHQAAGTMRLFMQCFEAHLYYAIIKL